VYVKWVKAIKRHPALFDGYTKGHGIIATRERFLRWLETDEGERGNQVADSAEVALDEKRFGKTIIMPIGVPGVGTYAPIQLLNIAKRKNNHCRDSRRVIPIRTHSKRRQKSATCVHSKRQESVANARCGHSRQVA